MVRKAIGTGTAKLGSSVSRSSKDFKGNRAQIKGVKDAAESKLAGVIESMALLTLLSQIHYAVTSVRRNIPKFRAVQRGATGIGIFQPLEAALRDTCFIGRNLP